MSEKWNKKHENKRHADDDQESTSHSELKLPQVYPVRIETTAKEEEKYAEETLNRKKRLRTAKALNWITGIGSGVALIGLIYLYGTLEATKKAADAATKAANISHMEQRPYMVAEAPRFVDPPTVGMKARATDFVRNIGKTPAVKVFINAQFIRYLDSSKSRPEIFAFLDSAFTGIRIENIESKQELYVRKDVAPGGPPFFRTDEDNAPLSQSDILQMTKGDLVFFYIGLASYSDSFGGDYETEYCFFFIGPDPKVWHVCDSHNTIK